MDKQKPKILIICGPTSTGKTSLALEICEDFNGSIISADSRQIFKKMDLGTGKIPVKSQINIERSEDKWTLNGIEIWGYDLVNPDTRFSAYEFARYVSSKSTEILASGKNVILVGGTGFYIDAVTGRIRLSGLEPDFELRNTLDKLNLQDLQEILKKENLDVYQRIDLKNRVRLISAIEKSRNGEKIENKTLKPFDADYITVGLTADRRVLYERADSWCDQIWNNGFENEVNVLMSLGYENTAPMKGLIYKTGILYIKKEINRGMAIMRTKFDLHSYIRRQQTWFKANKDIMWFDISSDGYKETVYNLIKEKLSF